MWTFLVSFVLLRRLGLAKPIRYALAVLLIGLIFVALIYALCLFITFEERTNPAHVYARNILDARASAAH